MRNFSHSKTRNVCKKSCVSGKVFGFIPETHVNLEQFEFSDRADAPFDAASRADLTGMMRKEPNNLPPRFGESDTAINRFPVYLPISRRRQPMSLNKLHGGPAGKRRLRLKQPDDKNRRTTRPDSVPPPSSPVRIAGRTFLLTVSGRTGGE
jgi:hypothetical protein